MPPPRRGRGIKRIVIACLVAALAVWLVLLIRLLLPQLSSGAPPED